MRDIFVERLDDVAADIKDLADTSTLDAMASIRSLLPLSAHLAQVTDSLEKRSSLTNHTRRIAKWSVNTVKTHGKGA
jgi:hypothetical protein